MRDALTRIFQGIGTSPAEHADRDPDDGAPEHEQAPAEERWKQVVRDNFAQWLQEVSQEEIFGEPDGEEDPPDLDSFFGELQALRTEFRKGARRSQDTFQRFGEALTGFEQLTRSLLSRLAELEDTSREGDILAKKRLYLPLVELFERFKRMEEKVRDLPAAQAPGSRAPLSHLVVESAKQMEAGVRGLAERGSPGRRGLFQPLAQLSVRLDGMRARQGAVQRRQGPSGEGPWRDAWENLAQAFTILSAHFEGLLRDQGISVVQTVGKPFDPSLMTAVSVEQTDRLPPDTVKEQFCPAYLYRGHVLKLAQVTVSREKGA